MRFRSALSLRSIIYDNVGGEDTPGCLHLFSFLSRTSKEEVKNYNIKHKDVIIDQQRRHSIGCNCW